MQSDDPNFPQEIPPIPAPRDPAAPASKANGNDNDIDPEPSQESGGIGPWTDTTASGDPDTIAPAKAGPIGADQADTNDVRESEDSWEDGTFEKTYLEASSVAEDSETNQPPVKPPGATDVQQRQAEKTVAANNSYDDWGQSEVPYQPKELGILDQLLLVLADGAAVWRKGMRWMRSQLPPNWQRRLSDEVMTAIFLGLLVLLLALWNPLGGAKTSTPVAEKPVPSPIEDTQAELPDLTRPADETPELAPVSSFSPQTETSPEQSLIADIQDRVSNISRSYGAGLIQSVEANLPENRLIVNLGENWYGLLDEQQDEISQGIFEQVQQLDFKTLQLRDPNGVVVARNPVVGDHMVILHRSRPSESDLLIS